MRSDSGSSICGIEAEAQEVMAPFEFAYVAGKDGRVTGNAVAVKTNLSWDDVGFCREQTGLPVFVKGILSSAQALEAERHGVCRRLAVQSRRAAARQNTFGHDSSSARRRRTERAATDHHRWRRLSRPGRFSRARAGRQWSRWGGHCSTAPRLAVPRAFKESTSTSGTSLS
jgi:FMN-dependent dehydrogenase